jgi:putative transposase
VIQKILIKLSDKVNLLIRRKITAPLQAVSSDISKIYYNQGKTSCYLCVHKDVKGQEVYGYEVAETMETELVMKSLSKACKRIRRLIQSIPKKILFHQDQGSQYTSYEYVEAVLQVGKLSYSRPGTPTENPGQESFFGRFKDEWREEIQELTAYKEVKRFINKKIRYYNKERIHTSIGYTTPAAYTQTYLKSDSKNPPK